MLLFFLKTKQKKFKFETAKEKACFTLRGANPHFTLNKTDLIGDRRSKMQHQNNERADYGEAKASLDDLRAPTH